MAKGPRLTLDNGGKLDRSSLHPREASGDANLPVERIGRDLCKARHHKGKQLGDVWLELKIRPEYLIAIEEGRFEALPGRIYAIGFVRSYAAYLGLDAEECVGRLKAEIAERNPPSTHSVHSEGVKRGDSRALHTDSAKGGDPRALHSEGTAVVPSEPVVRRLPSSESSFQHGSRVIVGLLLVGLIYSGYYAFASVGRIPQPRVLPVPERLLAEAHLPQEPIAMPPLAKVEQEAAIANIEQEAPTAKVEHEAPIADVVREQPSLPVEPVLSSPADVPPTQPVSVPAQPAPKVEAPAPRSGRYGLQNRNSRITLQVHRRTRVTVLGARNRDFIDRILAPGDTYRVPNMSGLRLTAADAGAVELILDGIAVGFAGKNGVRARGFPLTPQNLVRLRLTSAE